MADVLGMWGVVGIITLFVAVFGTAFIWDVLRRDSLEEAVEAATSRFYGLLMGAGSVLLTIAATSLDAVLAIPELVITGIGFGTIAGWLDISAGAFAAIALTVYVLGEMTAGRYV